MKFFHPRALHPWETIAVWMVSLAFMVCSFIVDRDSWFSATCASLQMLVIIWLCCCSVATARARARFDKWFWEEQHIISRVNLRLMELDDEEPTAENLEEFLKLTAEGRESLRRQREGLEAWGKML